MAKLEASQNWQVFGSVRNDADAERLKAELGASFMPLIFDVRDEAHHQGGPQVGASLGSRTFGGLVNNAGIDLAGPCC